MDVRATKDTWLWQGGRRDGADLGLVQESVKLFLRNEAADMMRALTAERELQRSVGRGHHLFRSLAVLPGAALDDPTGVVRVLDRVPGLLVGMFRELAVSF